MTDDEIDTIWWMAGRMKPGEFRKYMRVVFASIADTAVAKPCEVTPEEYAEYYHGARLHGLAPYTFAEYKKRAIAKESGNDGRRTV